jgi:ABC-type transporter Mla subunit MlaD
MAASLDRALQNIETLSLELRALTPQIGSAVSAGQNALEEADQVMRAAQGSFLLRGNLPPPADPPVVPAPRP